MHTLAIPVVPDPIDSRAVQVFVDVVADGIPMRMLLDTGAFRSDVPFREQAEHLPAPDRDTASPAKPLIRVRTLPRPAAHQPSRLVPRLPGATLGQQPTPRG